MLEFRVFLILDSHTAMAKSLMASCNAYIRIARHSNRARCKMANVTDYSNRARCMMANVTDYSNRARCRIANYNDHSVKKVMLSSSWPEFLHVESYRPLDFPMESYRFLSVELLARVQREWSRAYFGTFNRIAKQTLLIAFRRY